MQILQHPWFLGSPLSLASEPEYLAITSITTGLISPLLVSISIINLILDIVVVIIHAL